MFINTNKTIASLESNIKDLQDKLQKARSIAKFQLDTEKEIELVLGILDISLFDSVLSGLILQKLVFRLGEDSLTHLVTLHKDINSYNNFIKDSK